MSRVAQAVSPCGQGRRIAGGASIARGTTAPSTKRPEEGGGRSDFFKLRGKS